ncbi:hypothetical protein [Roseimicrobium sp. ORNL1]|uniref:hypothetical protein n=1 Tax=Roseimicrobium sp. ORNL1 TaxID=2711231 RepID=UPI0013E1D138|nr:hypothetical protein [Roseimicrobium sp. ORNL1]QIF03642.1 hypothetical protein G5S37_19650 [Roseimicrobium sp. ORNL1]
MLPKACHSQTPHLLRFALPLIAVVLLGLLPEGAQSASPPTSQPEEVVATPQQGSAVQAPAATATTPAITKSTPKVASLPWVRVPLVLALLLGVLGSLALGWTSTRKLALAWKGASTRGRVGILAKGFAGMVLWLSIASHAFDIAGYHGLVAIDLERSWQQVLEYAAAHGLSFGGQIIYTYGPLGFLTTESGLGGFATERALFGWASATVAAYLAFRVAFILPKQYRYLPWAWLLLSPGTEVMTAATVGVVLMSPPRSVVVAGLEVLGLAAYGAIMFSCKFTNVVAWSGMLGAVALYYLLCGQWKSALVKVVPFGVLGIAVWVFSGQQLSGLPLYISNALKISGGYDTMSIPAPAGLLFAAVTAAVALILLSLAGLWASPWPQKLRNLVKVLMILGCAFISWKHGFVRGDMGHVFLFLWVAAPYVILLLWACPVPAWLVSLSCNSPSGAGNEVRLVRARLTTVALVVVVVCTLGSMLVYTGNPAVSLRIPFSLSRGAHRKALATLSPDFRLPGVADLNPTLRAEADLPNLTKMVGTETVDVITNTQVWAVANHMNYAPRPIFQGYAAGSPELQRMNLAHYLSPATKPRYALLHLGPIDGRHPWLEDAPLLLHLATRWRPLWEDRGFVLLEEDPNARESTWTKVKSSKSTPWGKWVKFVSEPGRLLSLRVETLRTGYGRLKRFLYQGTQCEITLRLDTGEEVKRTFVPELAAEGFLVSPFFPAAPHFAEWRSNPAFSSPQVVAFKLAPVAGGEAEFIPTFKYQLSAYKYHMKARPAVLPQ